MQRTIFWSWQSDFGERENRQLIKESLIAAVDVISANSTLEERIEIDHDTKGLPGSPDIVSSILEKIDSASVFVGDITPIAVSDTSKQLANPNVLIELGYAKKSLGPEFVITVWNTYPFQSNPEHLPFDLRSRRGPIAYCLAPGASKEDYRSARSALSKQLANRLKVCLDSAPSPISMKPNWQPTIDGDPSIWLEPQKTFRVNEGWGSGEKYFEDGARWYVRVLPTEFDAEVLEGVVHGPSIDGYGGFSWGQTKGGTLTYSGSVRADVPPSLDAASMWFRENGEIWMFQNGVSGAYNGQQQFFGDYIAHKWLEYTQRGLAKLRDKGAKPPFHVKLGVTGLDGTSWPQSSAPLGSAPVALEDRIETEFSAQSDNIEFWFPDAVKAWDRLRRVFSVGKIDAEEVDRWRSALSR